jgi:hypothetical protein
MPILLLLLGLGVLLYLWFARRGSSLTRACRWRLDRDTGPRSYRCAACGALTTMAEGGLPKDCLKGTLPPGRHSSSGGTDET